MPDARCQMPDARWTKVEDTALVLVLQLREQESLVRLTSAPHQPWRMRSNWYISPLPLCHYYVLTVTTVPGILSCTGQSVSVRGTGTYVVVRSRE